MPATVGVPPPPCKMRTGRPLPPSSTRIVKPSAKDSLRVVRGDGLLMKFLLSFRDSTIERITSASKQWSFILLLKQAIQDKKRLRNNLGIVASHQFSQLWRTGSH